MGKSIGFQGRNLTFFFVPVPPPNLPAPAPAPHPTKSHAASHDGDLRGPHLPDCVCGYFRVAVPPR